MGDEEELPPLPEKYSLVTEEGEKPSSEGFTGKAKAMYTNGDVYEGLFENGVRQGKGKYMYRMGDVFEGIFENNLKIGLGKMTYKKGGFYHGHFKGNKRDGEGTFKYANGDIYSGMWKDGQRHGTGTYVFVGTKYELKGDWRHGQLTQGTWTFTDGTRYIGGFKQQKPCGDGIWQTAKGTFVEGAYVQQVVPDDEKPLVDATPATQTKIYWKTATMVEVEA